MPDDKSKRGGSDRKRVARDQPYEIGYFARKHGITREQAQQLMDKFGGDRVKLNLEAKKLKK